MMITVIVGFAWAAGCSQASGVDDIEFVDCFSFNATECSSGKADIVEVWQGVGVCRTSQMICMIDGWTSCTSRDITRQSDDICGDGLDNDCDGAVDENDGGDCACTNIDDRGSNTAKACYTGSPETRAMGVCHGGTQRCQNSAWGPCTDDVLPSSELCDGLDNNCNGEVDEGCECPKDGDQQPCYDGPVGTIGKGVCTQGTQTCAKGKWGKCIGNVTPKLETCEDKDLDCDGLLGNGSNCECINGDSMLCYSGDLKTMAIGLCRGGQFVCKVGKLSDKCEGEITPTPEVCNNQDDDCNGAVDDGIPEIDTPCQSEKYMGTPCEAGTRKCVSGAGDTPQCVPNKQPESVLETCNSIDDDCNGVTDDQIPCCIKDSNKNGSETGVDCGSSCADQCGDGQTCVINADCINKSCEAGFCQAPTSPLVAVPPHH